MNRRLKQSIIILVYLLIFSSLGYFTYNLLFPPTCSDGRQNGGEEGVDCGGPCQQECEETPELDELKIKKGYIIKDEGRYDAAAEIVNPNSEYGFSRIDYRLVLYRDNRQVGESAGRTYLLPGDRRYLIETGITCEEVPDNLEVVIEDTREERYKAKENPKLEIMNQSYKYTRTAGSFFEVVFKMANKSNFDLDTIDLEAVVKDADGDVIAVNKGTLNRIRSGDVRDHRFFWPREFKGNAKEVEVKAYTNIFDVL